MADEAIETDLLGREIAFSELTALRGIAEGVDGARARDIRRRHSSTVARSTINQSIMESDYPDRLARSVSPPAGLAAWNALAGHSLVEADDEDREDILGFWSRLPRSITSDDDEDDADDSEGESISSSEDEDEEDEEGDDDEIDDFELLGHR
ncbi:hypothetical protein GL218_00361 [Daldinia childiae]|uniref:uncharacterized protein n=1 Tax=Daldinia childiae TaxID=326645 RepID=UPI001444C95E|nr:uncharacterized protein GL218_00361 [Daldinia childiae]KAF3070937.1 hypothetical protein GL218_00361 [Daldinia childiae]